MKILNPFTPDDLGLDLDDPTLAPDDEALCTGCREIVPASTLTRGLCPTCDAFDRDFNAEWQRGLDAFDADLGGWGDPFED